MYVYKRQIRQDSHIYWSNYLLLIYHKQTTALMSLHALLGKAIFKNIHGHFHHTVL